MFHLAEPGLVGRCLGSAPATLELWMVFSDDFPEGQLVVSRKRWPNLESPTPQPALLPALAEHCVEYAKCFETCSDTTDCTRYPDMA